MESPGVAVAVVVILALWTITLGYWLFGGHGDRRHTSRVGHILVIASLIIGNGSVLLPPGVAFGFVIPLAIGMQITGVLALLLSLWRGRRR